MKRSVAKTERGVPEVYLAAFGKHPGWDDHIEDIGLETERLASFKQFFYVQGIGGAIDSGVWDKLPPGHRREGFRHVFVRRSGGSIIAGRLWSSVDGKGRARYPMVVCVECRNLPLAWVLQQALPRLEDLERKCRATRQAGDVIAACDLLRGELGGLAASGEVTISEFVTSSRVLAELADCPDMSPDAQGLLRILYQVERDMTPYLPGQGGAAEQFRPIHIRLPACGMNVEEVVVRWFSFLLRHLRGDTPLWIILPLDLAWADVLVGTPAPGQLVCLQVSREASPLASEIPYTLDDEFLARCRQQIDAARSGEAEDIVIRPERVAPSPKPGRAAAEAAGEVRSFFRSRGFLWAIAIIVALAIAAGVVALAMSIFSASARHPDRGTATGSGQELPKEDAEAWRSLCTAFSTWFNNFLQDVDEARLERWSPDEHLAGEVVAVLRKVQSGELKLDPRRIADVVGSDLRFLGVSPPRSVHDPKVMAEVRGALEAVRKLELAVSPAGWPGLRKLQDLSKQYAARGWARPAAYLAAAAARVNVDADLARDIDEAVAASAQANETEALWDKVQQQVRALAASGSPVLAKFGRYALLETQSSGAGGSSADMADLLKRLGDVQAFAAPLVAYAEGDWKTKVDRELVERNPPVAAPATDEDLRGGDVFRTWLAAVQGERYARLDPRSDPRAGDNWRPARLAELQDLQKRIDDCAGRGSKKVDAFRGRLKEIRSDLDSLCALRWDRENRGEITQRAAEFRNAPTKLLAAVGAELAQLIGGRDAYLKNLPADISATGSAAVNAAWRKRIEELKGIRDLADLTAKVNRLQQDLGRLESELPIVLGVEVRDREWNRKVVAEALPAEREAVLAKALAAMKWQDGQLVRDADFEAKWKAMRQDFERWRTDVAGLLVDFDALYIALVRGELPDEKLPGGSKTLRQLFEECRARQVAKEGSLVCQALHPVRQRLEELLAVEKSTDRAALAAQAAQAVGGQFEAARAAWKRLGQLAPPWPDSPAEFGRERELHAGLAGAFDLVRDAARKQALRDDLTGETRRRWEAYLLRQTDPARLDNAIARMGDFYLDADKPGALQPLSRFRIALYGLRQKVRADREALGDEAVRALLGRFAADVRGIGAGVADGAAVAGLLTELKEIAAAREAGVDLTKAGPAATGWKAEPSADGAQVKFTWATARGDRHSLLFARVEPAGGKPSYLCTIEASVGLFIDVVLARDKWAEFRGLLKDYPSPDADPRRGPRTWELSGSGADRTITLATAWTAPVIGVEESVLYAPDVKPGRPKRSCPMQYVSPAAAAYFAHLLGCRLPTSGEWLAAWQGFEKDNAGDVANLRDRTWDRQKRHIADCERQGKFVATGLYPDEGIFWPKDFKGRTEGSAAEALPADDGVLWLAPVDSGKPRKFNNLVGNVAEFVFEDPEAVAGPKGAAARGVADLLAAKADKLAVIGGSALSSPKVPLDRPQAVAYDEAAGGYSDVGFRLALTAPNEPLGLRLRRLLKDRGYLAK